MRIFLNKNFNNKISIYYFQKTSQEREKSLNLSRDHDKSWKKQEYQVTEILFELFLRIYSIYFIKERQYFPTNLVHFQVQSIKNFFDGEPKIKTEEHDEHIYIETLKIFMTYLHSAMNSDELNSIISYTLNKISFNKSKMLQNSIIYLIPLIASTKVCTNETVTRFLLYLRSISGEDEITAQNAINQILTNKQNFNVEQKGVLKELFNEIYSSFQNMLNNSSILNE